MKILVTGCAGFVGSSLVDRLLKNGEKIVGIDNLSTGRIKFIEDALKNPNFSFFRTDLFLEKNYEQLFKGIDFVYHLAANADVRFGVKNPKKDLEQNTIVTFNILEAMRKNNVKKIAFSSTGSIYGENKVIPTPEDSPFPIQTSFYGASKIACEGLISAYCEGFEFQAWIFRFVSILGERYTHGHIFDFYEKLQKDSSRLHILGNGKQKKSYLYIEDCLDAMELAIKKSQENVNILNLGNNEYCEVNDSVSWICSYLNVDPTLSYSGEERGWVGDNPFIFLDNRKISSLGWTPKQNIKDSVIKTIDYLCENNWVFNKKN